jgi:MFS transporter, PAT family, beta-lactamase induction signal transducer AmpG
VEAEQPRGSALATGLPSTVTPRRLGRIVAGVSSLARSAPRALGDHPLDLAPAGDARAGEQLGDALAFGPVLRNRKSAFMALFGFASGLPFALFLGTLYAWFTEAGVDLETMGVFSLIGLAYSFQFLWSPLVDKVDIPFLRRLGKRKQWIAPAQLLLGIILMAMSLLDPRSSLGLFSLLAGLGAFTSATQDIVINAWRIDIADEEATIDILSTVYQMGFRLAALVGGALGLIIAARIGWPQTYVMMGAILFAIGVAGLFAPDADVNKAVSVAASEEELRVLYQPGELLPQVRNWALLAVGLLWGWAIGTVGLFMFRSMTYAPEDRPDPTWFTASYGPLIIIATIVLPALIAGWLSKMKREERHVITGSGVARGNSWPIISIGHWFCHWSNSSAGWAGLWCSSSRSC